MNTAILGLLAETPVHPGSGRSMGVVDLPVAREAATDYPVLVGSGLKGALRDKAERTPEMDAKALFGDEDKAGDLLVSDARLLLLPVRSLTGAFRWVTCPHLVERFRRVLERAGRPTPLIAPTVPPVKTLSEGSGRLFLEERQFEICGQLGDGLIQAASELLVYEDTRKRLASQVAVLNDDDFAWFARFGLSIQARNVLEKDTKKSKNLWYEETLPPDTVMYALVAGRRPGSLKALGTLFPAKEPYLQAGGNETVGQGWFAVQVLKTPAGGEA